MRNCIFAIAIPMVLAGSCSAFADDKKHIEIQDYGFGVSMPVTTSRSSSTSTGRATHGDLTIQKRIDASSPLFQQSKSPTTTVNPALQRNAVGVGSRR
jgi:type VI protein secretion system component Hcp